MEMRIQNGDFVPDHRGIPQAVDGVEETINRVFFCLCARRGGFAPLPGLGSRLREISGSGENRDLTAAVMVREALRKPGQRPGGGGHHRPAGGAPHHFHQAAACGGRI